MSVNNKQVAVIDLGTNTFHLLLAEVDDRDTFTVLGKFKEPVKLGEDGITSRRISRAAFERGIEALKKFRKLIDSNGIQTVFAFATSAIRSAANGSEFVKKAKEEAAIDVEVINGNSEASYIHEGVKNGVQLPRGEDVLLIDIGGGSVEFIVSRDRQALLLRSLKIGAARLLEWLEPSDPIKTKELQKLQDFLDEELGKLLEELREFDLRLLVGSSGTFETIAAIIAYHRGDSLSADSLNGYRFEPRHFQSLFDDLKVSTRKRRLSMKGMDPVRADMIVMGAGIVDFVMQRLPIQEIMVSENALKEGILFRYMKDRRNRLDRLIGPTDQDLRAKAVKDLAEKYNYNRQHGLKVSELADSLFEQLSHLHRYGPEERELLRYAAVLHDIGRFIHPSSHHKHGMYLIMNSNPFGFSTNELVLLANLVRYHRKSLPKQAHEHFTILPKGQQQRVMWLSGMLRIADNLDRGHRNLVSELRVDKGKDGFRILVTAPSDVSLEIEHANNHREMLEKALGSSIHVEQKVEQFP